MKSNLPTLILLSLLLSACGGSSNSSNTNAIEAPDTTDESTDNESTDNVTTYTGIPYDYKQYQAALDSANLQQNELSTCTDDDINAYCSKSDVVDAGEYSVYESEYFYIDETSGWLTFEMQGHSNRTELRFDDNFNTNLTDTIYTLNAELLPINPTESVANSQDGKEMTLLQIHNKGENGETDDTVLSHPLLRVVWDGESRKDETTGQSYTEAYWAILKTNALECKGVDSEACDNSYNYYYLGEYDATAPTKFKVEVGNEQLVVTTNDLEKMNIDISYWSNLYSYFKAGVYNQYDDGNSVIQFKTLTYEVVAGQLEKSESTDTDFPVAIDEFTFDSGSYVNNISSSNDLAFNGASNVTITNVDGAAGDSLGAINIDQIGSTDSAWGYLKASTEADLSANQITGSFSVETVLNISTRVATYADVSLIDFYDKDTNSGFKTYLEVSDGGVDVNRFKFKLYGFSADGTTSADLDKDDTEAKTDAALATDVWQHVMVVYNAEDSSGTHGLMTIYVNGVEAATKALNDHSFKPNDKQYDDLLIAGGSTSQDKNFDGSLDNVALWNVALTASQVAERAEMFSAANQ